VKRLLLPAVAAAALVPAFVSAQGQGDPPPAGIIPCFAVGTDEEYVGEYIHSLGATAEYNLGNRWSGSQGNPRTVTWSLVPDGLNIPGSPSGPSELFSRLDSLYAGQGGRGTWILRIQQCFDRWEELTGLTFTRITFNGDDWDDGGSWSTASGNSNRGDIRIGMRTVDGGGNVLAFASFPGGGNGGNIVLDRAESWQSATNLNRFLRDVLMHELGHAVGVQHVCSSNSDQLMEPFIDTSFDGPHQDDIRAVQRHYGDPFESDNTTSQATNLGLLSGSIEIGDLPTPLTGAADPFAALLSIDADGEADYFRFTVDAPVTLTATVTPVGGSYFDADQNGDGSCPAGGVVTDGSSIANLDIDVLDAGGGLLAAGDVQPIGSPEILSNVGLPAAGDYYVRVYESGAPTQSQLYRLSLSTSVFYPDFCDASDGSLASCPCSNPGNPLSGCDLAQGTGGVQFAIVNQETAPQNRITAQGFGYPQGSSPSAVVIRGSSLDPAAPVVFGDGLRCVGTPLVRLGAAIAQFGFSDHTFGHGAGAGSGTFFYQLWFRNTPASFCDGTAAFNLSNGRSVMW
jgi:serralysin